MAVGLFAIVFIAYSFLIRETIFIPTNNDLLDRTKNEFVVDKNIEKYKPFRLVEEKVSTGGLISLNIPDNVDKNSIKEKISFEPKITGKFVEVEDKTKIVFKPDNNLKIGDVFMASMTLEDGSYISNDFVIAETPKILNIFPNENSEVDTNSEITIVFNRPMVSLSTLDFIDNVNVPVEILPTTKGRLKWTSTNILQFLPEKGLLSSSNYSVVIKDGFNSADGIKISTMKRVFKTKVLRYEMVNDIRNSNIQTLVYNAPLFLKFNQAIDLEKTKKEISLVDDKKSPVEYIAEYKKDEKGNIDESALLIYKKQDKYNRSKVWDFNAKYTFKLNKAYPKTGDIILNEQYNSQITITGPYSGVSVNSNRSNILNENVVDPKGSVILNFYEDIDLSKSVFEFTKINNKTYAKKCKDENLYMPNCDQEDDKRKVVITFDSSKIALGEKFVIKLKSIVNAAGLKINNEDINVNLKAYDALKITNTYPRTGSSDNKLNTFVVCSNNPLNFVNAEDFSKVVKSNVSFEYAYSRSSHYVDNTYSDMKCALGEYETYFYGVGLVPESNYSLELNLTDNFDQKAIYKTEFKTTKLDQKTYSFYNYQKYYNITTKDKTTLTYAAFNMDYVNVSVCRIFPETLLKYINKNPKYTEDNSNIECFDTINKTIELPKKYWVKNYFKLNIKDYFQDEYGHYLVTFSNPDYKDYSGKMVYERTFLTVTNLNVIEKKIKPNEGESDLDSKVNDKVLNNLRNLYFVSNISDLNPVNSADIDSYVFNSYGNSIKIKSYKTGSDGVVNTDILYKPAGVVIKNGKDSAIIASSEDSLEYASDAYNSQVVYLYSDRPIYKPGDTINFKGIYRLGYDGQYEIFKDKKIPVKVYDSNNTEIYNKELAIGDFGTFNDSLILSPSASVGSYRIESKNYNSYYFDVEEYVPAAFKLETKSSKEEYMAGENFSIDVDASYYFGAPLENGKVEYSIGSTDYYFDKIKSDKYYSFSDYSSESYYRDYFSYRGSTDLINGKATITGNLDFKTFFKENNRDSKIFYVYINVINSTGNTISTQQSFVVHGGKYYVGVNTDKSFLATNEDFKVNVKTTDLNGNNKQLNNVNLQISKISWIYNKRKEVDGSYYYNWDRKFDLVKEVTVNTDQNGEYTSAFNLSDEGEYIVVTSYTDDLGNKIKSSKDLYVYGSKNVSVRPTNDMSLDIVAKDTTGLKIGDKASVIIKSPYEKAKAFISIERGKVYEYKIIDINQNLFEYSFDIKKEYFPNVYLSVVLISTKPELKYGSLSFNVESDDKKIGIEIKSDKDVYLPGEKVRLNINTKDANLYPIESEVSLAIVDMSVLALKGNPKKDPNTYFYDYFPLTVSTSSNLKNILFEVDVPNDTKGGGGADPSDLANKKRGIFKDTAFWKANIVTDKNGAAIVEFTLPDNVTTWQVESLGITKDTKMGVAYKEFTTKKDIMLTVLKPRFVIPGDEFLVGAKLFNQSDSNQILNIAFDNGELDFRDKKKDLRIEIKKNESKNIYFKVYAPLTLKNDTAIFTLSAKNERYSDTISDSIKIKSGDVYETTATSAYSKSNEIKEYVYLPKGIEEKNGTITVNNSATLFPYVKSAMSYISNFDGDSSGDIISKLDSIITIKKINKLNISDKIESVKYDEKSYEIDKLVPILLSDLYKNYKKDLGFSYYPNMYSSDYYLTLEALNAFNNLKSNGFSIASDIYDNLTSVVYNKIMNEQSLIVDKDANIITVYILTDSLVYKKQDLTNLYNIVKNYIKDQKYLEIEASNISLIYLANLIQSNDNFDKKDLTKIYSILENRVKIDPRGAYLPSYNAVWRFSENSLSNTALFIDLYNSGNKNYVAIDKMLRWLLNSKNKDGYWGNSLDTSRILNAFANYMKAKQENDLGLIVDVSVNNENKNIYKHDTKENLTKQNSLELPISSLKKDKLNLISINKNDNKKGLYYDIALKYYVPIEKAIKRDEGFSVTNGFYKLDDKECIGAVNSAVVGEVLKGRVEFVVPRDRYYISLLSYIPAGFEIINFNLSTENQNLYTDKNPYKEYVPSSKQELYSDYQEVRDDRIYAFKEYLSAGVYTFDYYVRALIPGKYSLMPSYVSEKLTPENFGRTSGSQFVINQ